MIKRISGEEQIRIMWQEATEELEKLCGKGLSDECKGRN